MNLKWFTQNRIEIADDNIVNPNHKIFKKNSVYLQKNLKTCALNIIYVRTIFFEPNKRNGTDIAYYYVANKSSKSKLVH